MDNKPQDHDTFEHEIVPFHVRCPKCGQDGWLMERTFGVRPKPPSDFKTRNEREDGKVIYSEEIQLKKRRHPYKWMSLLDALMIAGGIKQRPHPTINPTPSILKRGDEGYELHQTFLEEIDRLAITLIALMKVMPLALNKYSFLASRSSG